MEQQNNKELIEELKSSLSDQMGKSHSAVQQTLTRLFYELSSNMKENHAETKVRIEGITHRQDEANGKTANLLNRVDKLEKTEVSLHSRLDFIKDYITEKKTNEATISKRVWDILKHSITVLITIGIYYIFSTKII